MTLPFRASTYVLIVGGLLLTILLGAYANKGRDWSVLVGVVALVFLLTMATITGIALLRQVSPKLCLVNFLLMVLFAALFSAASAQRRSLAREHHMKMRILELERGLQDRGMPVTPSDAPR